MIDLTTTYLGMRLKNPLIASASPLTDRLDNLRRMEDAGAAAVVLPSLFEEQIAISGAMLDNDLSRGSESTPEAGSYFPDLEDNLGPDAYLEKIAKAKRALSIPVIASLNGVSSGAWIDWAKRIEEAGANALELNIYFMAADTEVDGAAVEETYLRLASEAAASVRIPVAVKIGPYFSSVANMAKQFDAAGVKGLVLFNRFYQPDFDVETLSIVPSLSLSHSEELRLRLRWVAILYGRIKADMAVTGGIHTHIDVLKAMMAGGSAAMMTSALLREGIGHLTSVLASLRHWMEEREYASIEQMQGSLSQINVAQPAAFERANYMRVLSSYADAHSTA